MAAMSEPKRFEAVIERFTRMSVDYAEYFSKSDIPIFHCHDGSGIRSTVFFKGCNMRCSWCHNPESHRKHCKIAFYPNKCIRCGKCLQVCINGCHFVDVDGVLSFNRSLCVSCGKCADACYAKALKMIGGFYNLDEVMKIILADVPFYKNSGGGVTCSGGEPLMQPIFLTELLKKAHEAGIHTALDTAGNVDFSVFESVLPYVDLVLYDLKCMDDEVHKRVTGVSNSTILENLKNISARFSKTIWIRIPVIHGINDTPENMRETAAFIEGLQGIMRVELLPYHSLGACKYESLDLACDQSMMIPSGDIMKSLTHYFDTAEYDVVFTV